MKIEANIDKKYFLIILGIMFLLLGGLVYAYGTSSPSVVGHSVGEINWEDRIDTIKVGKISLDNLGIVSFYTPIASCTYPSRDNPTFDPPVEVYSQARYVDGQIQTRAWTNGGHKGYCNGKSSDWVNGLTASISYNKGDEKCRASATATKDGITVSGYDGLCTNSAYGW